MVMVATDYVTGVTLTRCSFSECAVRYNGCGKQHGGLVTHRSQVIEEPHAQILCDDACLANVNRSRNSAATVAVSIESRRLNH